MTICHNLLSNILLKNLERYLIKAVYLRIIPTMILERAYLRRVPTYMVVGLPGQVKPTVSSMVAVFGATLTY